jgi:type VI secretion system protein ImpL
MTMRIGFPQTRTVLAIVGLLLIALFVWFAGPYVAFADYRPLESVTARLVLILFVVALWALSGVVRRLRARRATDRLMTGVARSAVADTARPSDEVLQLRERFEEAVNALKQSLGRGRSLYDLPWYAFIGAPGSGKTTALVNSGLKFPLEQRMGKGALRGVGGTRNCDWWFTDEAVFLDTAGRYTTQDSDAAADSAAWAEFLALLRNYRKRRPLNGVILTISAHDLMTLGPEGRAAHVAAARRRLDELNRELRVRLPVYVMVTKCDLVDGFAEYFEDLAADGRGQVWGTTFTYQQTVRGEAAKAFGGDFDALMVRLNERVLGRLEEEVDARRRTKVFGFPQQMAALKPQVEEIVEEIFGSTRFDGRILLRGVYFTSGTQEGTPVDRLLSAIGRRFGVVSESVLPAASGRGKAYFIARLLKDVLIGESGVAGVNWKQELRQGAVQFGAYVALAAVAVLGLVVLSLSYSRNRSYLAEVSAAVDTLGRTSPVVAGAPVQAVMPRLDAVGAVADVANRYSDDTPWAMRWGLFQGHSVGNGARDAYARELQNALLPYLVARIERRLTSYAAEPDKLYEYLKAYMMLGHPEHLDKKHLGFVADLEWNSDPNSPVAATSLSKHFKGLLESDLTLPAVPLDPTLVAQAQSTIRGASIARLVYNRLKLTQSNDPTRGLRLDLSAGVGADRVLRRKSGVKLSDPIPRLYTAEGFREVTGVGATAELVAQFGGDSWIWGQGGLSIGDSARLAADVIDLYEADYIAVWDEVLKDIDLVPFGQNADALAVLSAPTSPLRGLLQTVDANTFLVKPADAAGGVVSSAEQTLNKLFAQGKAAVGMPTTTPGARITARFNVIHQLMAGAPGSAPIDRILTQLQAIRQAMLSAGTGPGQTRPLDAVADPQLNAMLTALRQDASLLPPAVAALVEQVGGRTQATLSSGATTELTNRYMQEVRRECAAIIEGRYPFTPGTASEVPLDDFGRLFGYGGVFDGFFTTNLEKVVDTTHASWTWRSGTVGVSTQILRQFEEAQRIRRMFFTPGSKTPEVRFTVAASDMDNGASKFRLELDGKRFEYTRSGVRSFAATWPGGGAGQVVTTFETGLLGGKPTKAISGPWAWLRFVDANAPQRESDVRVMFRYSLGGHSVTLRLEASRIDNPLTDRSWQQFRCGF